MSETIDTFRDLLKIDKLGLDEALMEQADIYYRVSEHYALAISRRDAAKDECKRVEARVYRELKADAAEDGVKMTEAAAMQAIEEEDEVIDAKVEYLKHKEAADLWLAMKESFHQRSYMLREMVQLFVSNYYIDSAVNKGDAGDMGHHARRERMHQEREKKKEGKGKGRTRSQL